MANGTIVINGVSYLTHGKVQCDPAGAEPEQTFIDGYVKVANFETNLLSDVMFYLPDKHMLCRAAVLNTLPEKGELKLNEFPRAKILYKQSEHHKEISSVGVKSGDKELDEQFTKTLEKNYGITTRKWIDINKLERFKEDLLKLSAGLKKIIDIKIVPDPEDKEAVKIEVTLRDIPKTVEVVSTVEGSLALEESAIIGSAVQTLVDQLPVSAIGMYYNTVDLPVLLSGIDMIKVLDVTPVLNSASIEGDKLIVKIDVQKGMPPIKAGWTREFLEYIYTRPESERKEAMGDLDSIEETLSEARNRSELFDKETSIKKDFADGWTKGKKNYMIIFKETPSPDGSSIAMEVNRVPIPTKMIVEGDYPGEDKPAIDAFLQPAMDKGKVDITKVEDALTKIKEYYNSKGMKIRELKYTITHDGALYVTLVLRRWDAVYLIEVENSGGAPKDKEEQAALMNKIMAPLQGKFITQEDIDGLKKKFGRGFSRSDVEVLIATDAETERTRVIFAAGEGRPRQEYSGAFSAGGAGLFLVADAQMADNGHGTAYGASGALFTKWKAFESRSVSDIYYESLKLNWATSTGPDESVSIGVYEWIKNYGDSNQQTYGAEAHYHQYFLNDALTLSTGGGIELIRHSGNIDGYTDFPVRFRLDSKICYSKNGLKVCVKNGASAGAANYGKSSVYLSYAIPLGGSSNAPFIQFKTASGVEYGSVPMLEQFNELDTGLPFAMSLLDGTINFSKYYAGASVELVQVINEWFGIKPVVATIKTIGDNASVTTGSCIFALGMQVCVGYKQNIANTKSGLAISLEPAGEMDVPQPLKSIISNYLLGTQLGDPNK